MVDPQSLFDDTKVIVALGSFVALSWLGIGAANWTEGSFNPLPHSNSLDMNWDTQTMTRFSRLDPNCGRNGNGNTFQILNCESIKKQLNIVVDPVRSPTISNWTNTELTLPSKLRLE